MGEDQQGSRPTQKVNGRVKWFNRKEGYGFIELDGQKNDAYLSLTVAEEFGRNSFDSGDQLVCDVVKTQQSFQVVSISDYTAAEKPKADTMMSAEGHVQMGTVVFYNSEKGFGFIKPFNGVKDILLPRRVLNSVGLATIDEGTELLVESEMQLKGPVATSILVD